MVSKENRGMKGSWTGRWEVDHPGPCRSVRNLVFILRTLESHWKLLNRGMPEDHGRSLDLKRSLLELYGE